MTNQIQVLNNQDEKKYIKLFQFIFKGLFLLSVSMCRQRPPCLHVRNQH